MISGRAGWALAGALCALVLGPGGLAGCGSPSVNAEVSLSGNTVTVQAGQPGAQIEVLDSAGVRLARVSAPEGGSSASVVLPPSAAGQITVLTRVGTATDTDTLELGPANAVRVELTAPLGGAPRAVAAGDVVPVTIFTGASAQMGVRLRAPEGQPAELRGEGGEVLGGAAAGAAELLQLPLHGTQNLRASSGEHALDFSVVVSEVPATAASLSVVGVVFPAHEWGAPDLVRPPGRITLPSPLWRTVLNRLGFGVRGRDEYAPWSHVAVTLQNHLDVAIDLVVRARVLGPNGQPAPAFRPRLRTADDGTGQVSGLLRLPPKATNIATLPVFVNEAELGAGPFTLEAEVLPIGLATPLTVERQALHVSRGSSWVAGGLTLTLLAAAAGLTLLALRLGTWLREMGTPALVTIALFASLKFVVGTAALFVGLGVAAAVGPFATLLTGLFDDAFDTALLATLLTLLPRVGTASLSTVVSWLLRGVATGGFSPLDFVFLGSRVALLEGSLWAFGLTRSGAWREEPRGRRLLRTGAAFSVASLLGTASSLVLHSALFRLFFAEWYVWMVLAGPGFLYVVAATGIADRVATRLRRVED